MTANPGGGDYLPARCADDDHEWGTGPRCAVCYLRRPPASVAQDATEATETPARTPGGSEDAEAYGVRESATGPGMTNLDAELVALRAQVARLQRVDNGRLAADLDWMDRAEAAEHERDEARAQVARVRALADDYDRVIADSSAAQSIREALDGA